MRLLQWRRHDLRVLVIFDVVLARIFPIMIERFGGMKEVLICTL